MRKNMMTVIGVASLLLLAGVQSTQAQTGSNSDAKDVLPEQQLKDYVPCQFPGEVEARWRQDSAVGPLHGAKYAVRTKLGQLQIDKSERDSLMSKLDSIGSIDELKSQIHNTVKAQADQQVLEFAVQEGQNAERVAPNDVSCSQSIMSFKEASDILGKRMANRYVVVQVVVRNLNEDYEFILHDVQAAVPDGKEPFQRSHFRAGRDKLLARGVATRGQSQDPRNLLMGGLDALSATAQGATSFASGDFNLGTSCIGSTDPATKALVPGLYRGPAKQVKRSGVFIVQFFEDRCSKKRLGAVRYLHSPGGLQQESRKVDSDGVSRAAKQHVRGYSRHPRQRDQEH
jgi:hypothetical protein